MYLKKFPDIEWIRKNALQDFAGGKDYLGNPLPTIGWPNAVINVKSSATERNGIKGPFSLFYNFSGASLVGINNSWHKVTDYTYCVSNDSQTFNLHIPEDAPATTFNIHFGKQLYQDVIQRLAHKDKWSLDNFNNPRVPSFEILPRTSFLGDELKNRLNALRKYIDNHREDYSEDKEYEMTASILQLLLLKANKDLKKAAQISAQKASTRKELLRRVSIGVDYMHSSDPINVDLDSISRNCGLSKFHFIRVFKEIYGQTPSNYISMLTTKKAQLLVLKSDRSLNQIALELGFSELSAFTRFYKRMTGQTPSSLKK